MGEVVTWQEAEDAMIAAVEYLAALPDRERGFLSAGSRSAWPQIIRDRREGDYPDADVAPSAQLSRRMMAHLERMLLTEQAAGLAVAEGHRALVGRVLMMKLWPGPDGFRWERVWEREGGKACGVTSDALRMRYERGIGKVAVRMQALGMDYGAAA